ncbi:nucleotidyltransferase domain-containing protein [Lentiprolixibacter aurantiacus]|uniref:Nucleotidyltransferase domain-containing protein n=1 Tax=Lentiprolixibacter aurantiacus TaxID=2993939 RepID=A0AAE3MI68_9FLAO|nr:nucleotidyltransferase domain-containing protein [Lentiprolixibacter aurantiacus]MCX2718130.1 nucleotidyltransferase domain-containing protein [Lentiprolixibacter aurantiacus]
MDYQKLHEILNVIQEFAAANEQILAVGLCGSWARGAANSDSDIDLSFICRDKEFFKTTAWLQKIDFKIINSNIIRFEDQKYGVVWSRHVFLEDGTEIEFSFADTSWANIDPLDTGTEKVVSDGYRILYDPHQLLKRLLQKVKAKT